MRSEKIIVLGATGDLGMAIVFALKDVGVTALLRDDSSHKFIYRYGREPAMNRMLVANYYSKDLIEHLTDSYGIIINMSGMVSLNYDISLYPNILLLNSIFPSLVCEDIKKKGKDTIVFYPSTQRISNTFNTDCQEWIDLAVKFYDSIRPIFLQDDNFESTIIDKLSQFLVENPIPRSVNVYELSKALGENLVSRYKNTIILRISSCYGPGCSLRRSVGRMIYSALNNESSAERQEIRDYMYIDDFTSIIKNLLNNKTSSIVEYCVSGSCLRKDQVVSQISRSLLDNKKCSISIKNDKKNEKFFADNTWSRSQLKRDFTSPKEGIQKTITYLNNNYFMNTKESYINRMEREYDRIKQIVDETGLDPKKINFIKKTFFEQSNGIWKAKPSFHVPTGLVLGYPFDQEFTSRVLAIGNIAIKLLSSADTEFSYWQQNNTDLHTTIVSYSHYDEQGENVLSLPVEQYDLVGEICAEHKKINIHFRGILITPDGSLLIKGYPEDATVAELRSALQKRIEGITQKKQNLLHIKLGQILSVVPFNIIDQINTKYANTFFGVQSFSYARTPDRQTVPFSI
jgi:nucleoside-diphosphate-sugar epimerase